MYLVYTPDGIVLVRGDYVTCLNLLFSNRRVQIYIQKRRLLDMRTDVRTDPPAEDVEHVGDVLVRRRWVQFARRPESMIWSIGRAGGKSSVGARLPTRADVYFDET